MRHVAGDALLRRGEQQHVEAEPDHDEQQGGQRQRLLQVVRALDLRRHDERQSDDRRRGPHRPEARQPGAFDGLLRHRGRQRAVGDVHEAVGQPQRRVGDVRVDELARAAQSARDGERGDGEQQQGERAEQEEGAELAPAGHRLVDLPAGPDVREGVPDPHDEEQGPRRRGRDADDVGVVEQQEHRRHGERQVVARVPGGVAEVRAEPELGRGGRGGDRVGDSDGAGHVDSSVGPRGRGGAGGGHGLEVQRRRSTCAAAFGRRSRVKTPFLLPSTRNTLFDGGGEVREVPDLLTDDGVDRVEHAVVHLQVLDLVLLGPRLRGQRVHPGDGVGAVLGDDDRLAVGRPLLQLRQPRRLGRHEVARVDVPAVVAVEHDHVAELGDLALPVGREHHVDEADRPAPVQLAGEREERLEVGPCRVGVGLGLVGDRPEHDARVVLVPADQLTDRLLVRLLADVVDGLRGERRVVLRRRRSHRPDPCSARRPRPRR